MTNIQTVFKEQQFIIDNFIRNYGFGTLLRCTMNNIPCNTKIDYKIKLRNDIKNILEEYIGRYDNSYQLDNEM